MGIKKGRRSSGKTDGGSSLGAGVGSALSLEPGILLWCHITGTVESLRSGQEDLIRQQQGHM